MIPQYAMVDRDDDLKVGIKSTAILFGRSDKIIVGLLQLGTLGVLIALGGHAGVAPAVFLVFVVSCRFVCLSANADP